MLKNILGIVDRTAVFSSIDYAARGGNIDVASSFAITQVLPSLAKVF